MGNVNPTLDLGDGQVIANIFKVLSDVRATRILGRDLLENFHSTE